MSAEPITKSLPFSHLHHSIFVVPNGNILTTGIESKTVPGYPSDVEGQKGFEEKKDALVIADVVAEFDMDGNIIHKLSMFDVLDVYRNGYDAFGNYYHGRGLTNGVDWTHSNSVVSRD